MILNTILDAIGHTPIVRLNCATHGTKANIFVKLEMFNPGGSHKTRIAFSMIKQAEASGELRSGSGQTILEPTGGNTGMGIAIAGAVLGYRVILVIPDNYSKAKQKLLKAFGAEIVLSNTGL